MRCSGSPCCVLLCGIKLSVAVVTSESVVLCARHRISDVGVKNLVVALEELERLQDCEHILCFVRPGPLLLASRASSATAWISNYDTVSARSLAIHRKGTRHGEQPNWRPRHGATLQGFATMRATFTLGSCWCRLQ